jgi:hypothetical protein
MAAFQTNIKNCHTMPFNKLSEPLMEIKRDKVAFSKIFH